MLHHKKDFSKSKTRQTDNFLGELSRLSEKSSNFDFRGRKKLSGTLGACFLRVGLVLERGRNQKQNKSNSPFLPEGVKMTSSDHAIFAIVVQNRSP